MILSMASPTRKVQIVENNLEDSVQENGEQCAKAR